MIKNRNELMNIIDNNIECKNSVIYNLYLISTNKETKFFNKDFSFKEMQEMLFEIYIYIKNTFYMELDIKLWAHSGTLLGFIREKGMIKWDDDIDLAANYKDIAKNYNKIKKILNEINISIFDFLISNEEDVIRMITRNKFRIWKYDKSCLNTSSLVIEIMPTAETSYSGKKIQKLTRARSYLWTMQSLINDKKLWIFIPFFWFSWTLIKIFRVNWLIKKYMFWQIERNKDEKEQLIYTYSAREIFIEKIITINILDNEVFIPENYIEVLDKSYGGGLKESKNFHSITFWEWMNS